MLFKTEADFQALYAHHAGGVRRFLAGMVKQNHAVAEELCQDTFLKAWKSLPTFAGKSSLKTWVYAVALNTARDWLRSHKHVVPLSGAEAAVPEIDSAQTQAIQAALSELEPEPRALLMLHYYDEMSLKEIATVLAIPEGTVKSRLYSAKAQLKPALLKQGFAV